MENGSRNECRRDGDANTEWQTLRKCWSDHNGWMLFEYANNASENKRTRTRMRKSENEKERKRLCHGLQNSIRSQAKIRWDYFVSRAKGKSRILNINAFEWIKNYSIPCMRCAHSRHTSPVHTHTQSKCHLPNKRTFYSTIEKRQPNSNTTDELCIIRCFQETDTIFLVSFVIIPLHFPTVVVVIIAIVPLWLSHAQRVMCFSPWLHQIFRLWLF